MQQSSLAEASKAGDSWLTSRNVACLLHLGGLCQEHTVQIGLVKTAYIPAVMGILQYEQHMAFETPIVLLVSLTALEKRQQSW